MNFKVGDFVTRVSHKHDVLFKITNIEGNMAYLKGVNFRLIADCELSDLVKSQSSNIDDQSIIDENVRSINLERNQFFYLPGKILHIDGDSEYLDRCMSFYSKMNVKANGITIPECDMADKIENLLNEYRPDIVVITGHDAFYSNKRNINGDKYQNSVNFIETVKKARRYEKNQDKLIVIAGACQSNYEDLIKAGANFASSPKRVNIHALDPAIIASSLALAEKNKNIDLISLIEKTKYGSDGIGGIITTGTMYVGYPR